MNIEESILKIQHRLINSGYHQERFESWAALGRKLGINYAYPYLDKRIIEFALSLPSSLYFKNEQSRYLYKLSTENYLPSFMLDKRKPSETNRVTSILDKIFQTLTTNEILIKIKNSNSIYIDHEQYLQQYLEIMRKFEKIEDKNIEELMRIDKVKSLLLIKKMS